MIDASGCGEIPRCARDDRTGGGRECAAGDVRGGEASCQASRRHLRMPVLDQPARDRDRWRQQQAIRRRRATQRGIDLGEGEPARVLEFVADLWRVRFGVGDEAQHQRRGKRPRLRREIAAAAHAHAAFLEHFAGDGLFQRFARLDESGQRRIAVRRPAGVATQQQAFAIADRDDHRRIGARVVFEPALQAMAEPAGAQEFQCAAADAAMAMARLPVQQRARLREGGRLECRPTGRGALRRSTRSAEPACATASARTANQASSPRRPRNRADAARVIAIRASGDRRLRGEQAVFAVGSGAAFGIEHHDHAPRGQSAASAAASSRRARRDRARLDEGERRCACRGVDVMRRSRGDPVAVGHRGRGRPHWYTAMRESREERRR